MLTTFPIKQPLTLFTTAVLLFGASCGAQAGTMYKCVAPDGKVSFVTQPCSVQAKEARQFAVPPPEENTVRDARLKKEWEKLRAAAAESQSQMDQRDAVRASDAAEHQRVATANADFKDFKRTMKENRKIPTSHAEDCARFPAAIGCR